LAIKTADASGEEFPAFKAFWIERPQSRSGSIVVHALLDGPSAAASFRFSIITGSRSAPTRPTMWPGLSPICGSTT
jgi:periplasmic glucans biosynthesis protein